ncbi:MAG: BamA/TamA family outer membrane protein [Gammaproteobacteria bacterium]
MLNRLLFVLVLILPGVLCAAVFSEAYPYRLELSDASLKAVLHKGLATQRAESAEFKSYERPEKAAQFDRNILNRLLKSEGYYAAQVNTRLLNDDIVHTVIPGPMYRVARLQYHFPEYVRPLDSHELPLQKQMPLKAHAVLETEKRLKNHILDQYCLYDVDMSYRVQLNHKTRQAFVTYTLQPSPPVYFDTPHIVGNKTLKSDYVNSFFTFKKGDCFKRKAVELTRIKLLQTNLIVKVDVAFELLEKASSESDASDQDAQKHAQQNGSMNESPQAVRVTFDILERKHKTVKTGLGYNGDIGSRFLVGWQHRNARGRGELLDVEARTSPVEDGVFSTLKVPHFRHMSQTLELNADLETETTDQFESKRLDFGATLSRPFREHWNGSLGFSGEIGHVEGEDYQLLSFPLTLTYLNTEDRFNPETGWGVQLQIRPFSNVRDDYAVFVKNTFTASAYYTPHENKAIQSALVKGERDATGTHRFWLPTIAGRVSVGSINAGSLDAVTENHRFYVGGGGSVRGYAYQSVGDLNDANETDGGLSFAEYSLELRFRINENWGMVLFQDAGYAYPGERPRFGTDFVRGAGFGVRYFTSFAPIRLDIATALDPREYAQTNDENASLDSDFELYISIGQAF